MTTDDHGQPPQAAEGQDTRTALDAQPPADVQQQTMSLSTQQAAQQLGVDSRTVRRYIAEGIRTAGGGVVRLEARQVRSNRGPEWQIYQHDLEAFKEQRDRAATEGSAVGQLTAAQQPESQALTTSINIIATELERRSVALTEAQATIERLAREAGQYAGRNEALERELEALRKRVADLEQERDQQQKTQKSPPTKPAARRIWLLRWGGNKDNND